MNLNLKWQLQKMTGEAFDIQLDNDSSLDEKRQNSKMILLNIMLTNVTDFVHSDYFKSSPMFQMWSHCQWKLQYCQAIICYCYTIRTSSKRKWLGIVLKTFLSHGREWLWLLSVKQWWILNSFVSFLTEESSLPIWWGIWIDNCKNFWSAPKIFHFVYLFYHKVITDEGSSLKI